MQGSHRCEGTSSNVHRIVENGSFCASGSSKWLDLGLKRQKSSTDRLHVFFSTGWQSFIAIEAAIKERKDRHGDGGLLLSAVAVKMVTTPSPFSWC
jgi:hypothetical protein